MSVIDEIVSFNKSFVERKEYKEFSTDKFPNKKLAILSCMDTRLIELIPAALNIKNGDAKIIKNAGALISHPFGSVMRSLLVAVYELGVEEIMILGHTGCGMHHHDTDKLVDKMIHRGISKDKIEMLEYCGVDVHHWLKGFDSVEESVRNTAKIVRNHILMPRDINVHSFVIDVETGKLTEVK
ncbi:MAG: carbonic anhydrase [Alphaproteobacteria bacterium]|nr:carbonic anhydrase [Alphaproteobacteria bacterium]